MLASRITHRVRRDYYRWRYLQAARYILATAPLRPGTLPFILLSMVHRRDILSYLTAVKSFSRFASPKRIVVICDPSMDEADCALLMRHIPHIELRRASEFTHQKIPCGGTWERLFSISEYVTEEYVVQLDADTITCNAIPEVLNSIHSGSGFVLGESSNQRFLSLEETSANAKAILTPTAHIQTLSEAVMDDIGFAQNALYVRGCSGFTGFPKTSFMRDNLLYFSEKMAEKLGHGWTRWGTEQVTSNFLVANASNASVLPFPKYSTPDVLSSDTAFLHFIGSMRFTNNKYEKTTLISIQSMPRIA